MNNVEIERKFLVRKKDLPKDYKECRHAKIVQAFIYLKPCIRIRKSDDNYFLTVKSAPPKAMTNDVYFNNDIARSEYEIKITKKAYNDLLKLCKGRVIYKTRYYLHRSNHTIELDIFEKDLKGLIYAEVEFDNISDAHFYPTPSWFYKEVTGIDKYKNTSLSICKNVESLLKYDREH